MARNAGKKNEKYKVYEMDPFILENKGQHIINRLQDKLNQEK